MQCLVVVMSFTKMLSTGMWSVFILWGTHATQWSRFLSDLHAAKRCLLCHIIDKIKPCHFVAGDYLFDPTGPYVLPLSICNDTNVVS